MSVRSWAVEAVSGKKNCESKVILVCMGLGIARVIANRSCKPIAQRCLSDEDGLGERL